MPWYGYLCAAVGTSIVIPFWTWVAIKIFQLRAELSALRNHFDLELTKVHARLRERESACKERLIWMRDMDKKLDTMIAGLSKVMGKLEERD